MDLLFLPDQNFDCSGCGRCCRTPWAVHVDAACRDAVQGSDLELEVLRETGRPGLVADADGRLRTASTDRGCVFLDPSNRCRIHSGLRQTAKPISCLQFPLVIVPTPDGVVVGTSFYCPSVQRNLGRPLPEHAGEVRELLERVRYRPLGQDGIPLAPDREADWATCREIEAALGRALEARPPEAAVLAALKALCRLLDGPAERGGCGAAHGTAPETQGSPGGERAPGSEGANEPGPPERDDLAPGPQHAGASDPDPAWEAMTAFFMAALVGYLEAEAPDEARPLTKAVLEGGALRLRRFEWFGEGRRIAEYAARQEAGWLEGEVARYLRALVFRKFLIQDRPVLDNLALLYLLPRLLTWYAMASGLARGSEPVSREDLYRAFDVVETELISHGRGIDGLAAHLATSCRQMLG